MTTAEPLQPLTPDEDALVHALPRVMYALPRAIDADMVREQQLPLIEWTALMRLSEAPQRRMRMGELAVACELSLSGMTRIVTRLEGQGLIERVRCDDDARGWNAVLTDAGLDRLERAWPSNLASVRRHFLDHLQGIDLARLARAIQNIATND
ncbi:MarR family transcriptional regulator [Planotetraspora sp. A-T 1434]|uniref:MarR family winged helix-turn-helix transcriptional regulator n=1 Tax=Planotetraspora sp. A-T 1434 TaxID=2979219 RepID=UPI0021BF67C5|nr:MarR family transcriptional regulator [Planotetraspora sp. A-T 1434]MCT9932160.1 MarR family transcriptional regulator [Planotetraspora sp. A-T 1434]